MRSAFAVAALCSLVAAAPRPQMINVNAVKKLPLPSVLGPDIAHPEVTPAAYDPKSAAAAAAAAIPTDPVAVYKRSVIEVRNACEVQPGGAGPVPGSGSVTDYLNKTNELATKALSAKTPSGYTMSFTNLQGSTQQIGYLTYKNLESGSYDVDGCASFCDSVAYCIAFNIYYERDPSVDAADACPNPTPITNVKCSLYGYPISAETAKNDGQWRGPQDSQGESFHVVIAGSNGYSKNPTPEPQPGFTGPSKLLTGAINAPLANGTDTYLGMKMYNSVYDPSLCAAACQAQTAYDRATAGADGSYKACNFFNSYILSKNGAAEGTYCSFYTRTWDESYAVNTGYQYGSDVYEVSASFTFSLSKPDPGHL